MTKQKLISQRLLGISYFLVCIHAPSAVKRSGTSTTLNNTSNATTTAANSSAISAIKPIHDE